MSNETIGYRPAMIAVCMLVLGVSLGGCGSRGHAPSNADVSGPPKTAVPAADGAWTPRTFTCQGMGMSAVVEPDKRIDLNGFSVLPPTGPNWCIQERYGGRVILSTSPLLGRRLERRPSMAEVAHTFEAHATQVSTQGRRIGTLDELEAFAHDWADAGFTSEAADPSALLTTRNPRISVLRSSITPDRSLGADCVRLSATYEETGNPRSPSGAFTYLLPDGLLCLHPRLGSVIMIGYSERYPRGEDPHPPLAETLQPELARFMQSLELASS